MTPMFPISTKQGGTNFAFPDTCLTPPVPVPVPYPNTAMLNQATKASRKVKVCGKPVLTLKSEIPRSMGDEAGTAGGIMSGQNMAKVIYKLGSSKVKVEGQKVVHATSMTGHNGMNSNMPAGLQVAPSQTKVLVSA